MPTPLALNVSCSAGLKKSQSYIVFLTNHREKVMRDDIPEENPRDPNGRYVNVGTIGHIDHGKTTLTSALARVVNAMEGEFEERPSGGILFVCDSISEEAWKDSKALKATEESPGNWEVSGKGKRKMPKHQRMTPSERGGGWKHSR
jgi:hypothetical protein